MQLPPPTDGSIFWFASYPKSGNTWLRIFLANLLSSANDPVDINNIQSVPATVSSRSLFDRISGLDSSNLSDSEIQPLRSHVLRHWVKSRNECVWLKTHDGVSLDGSGVVPLDVTKGAICIVRNPLDVAVSYAHHCAMPVDRIIAIMAGKPRISTERHGLPIQLSRSHWHWSTHSNSWLAAPFKVLLVRYEDLLATPELTFGQIVRFMELPVSPARTAEAVALSAFPVLQAQERQHGFIERKVPDQVFFRQGKSGGWRQALTPAQIDAIVDEHGECMQQLGYLDDQGVPV